MASSTLLPMTPTLPADSDDSDDKYSLTSFASMDDFALEDIEAPSPDRSISPTSSLEPCECHGDEYCRDAVIETVELALVVRPKLIEIPPRRRPPPPPVDNRAHATDASACNSDVTPAITVTQNPLSDARVTSPSIDDEPVNKRGRKDSVTLTEALASDPPATVSVTSSPASAFCSPSPPKARGFKRLFQRKNKNGSTCSDPSTQTEPFPEISRPMTPDEQQFSVSYSDDLEPSTTVEQRTAPKQVPASDFVFGTTANRRHEHHGSSGSPATPRNDEARKRVAEQQYVDAHYRNLSATTTTPATAPTHRYKYADTIGLASRSAAAAAPGAMMVTAADPIATPSRLRHKKSLKQLVKRSGSDSMPISYPIPVEQSWEPLHLHRQHETEKGDGPPQPSGQQGQQEPVTAGANNNTAAKDTAAKDNHSRNNAIFATPVRAARSGSAATMSPASSYRSPAGSQASSPWPSRKSSLAPPPTAASPSPSNKGAAAGASLLKHRQQRSGDAWDNTFSGVGVVKDAEDEAAAGEGGKMVLRAFRLGDLDKELETGQGKPEVVDVDVDVAARADGSDATTLVESDDVSSSDYSSDGKA